MRRITSALALAGMAGGIVLTAASPAMAANKPNHLAKADVQDTTQQLALSYIKQIMHSSLSKQYGPGPMPMPPHGNTFAPVNVSCYIIKAPSLIDLSGLGANFCVVANGPGATVSGGIGIDTVNILP